MTCSCKSGSDESGSDESGSDESGSDESGSDENGSDESGSDESGSDENGSDESGSDKSGSDENGSDESGSDESGSWDRRWVQERLGVFERHVEREIWLGFEERYREPKEHWRVRDGGNKGSSAGGGDKILHIRKIKPRTTNKDKFTRQGNEIGE